MALVPGTYVQNAYGGFTKHFIKCVHLTEADNICEVQSERVCVVNANHEKLNESL